LSEIGAAERIAAAMAVVTIKANLRMIVLPTRYEALEPRCANRAFDQDQKRANSANRCFPPPWSVEDTRACFVVKGSGAKSSAISIIEKEPGFIRRKSAAGRSTAKMLTKDEARRITAILSAGLIGTPTQGVVATFSAD
jgi:hypothetical protein